jgi:hypothetical protein
MNTIFRASMTLTISATLALTGCASIGTGTDSVTQKIGGVFGSSNGNTRAATGGAIAGCGLGAIAGKLLGKNMLASCVVAGAAGALVSVEVHKHEVDAAKKLAADAKASLGVNATVATKPVDAIGASGQKEQTEELDALTIPLPSTKVSVHAADVGHVIDKATAMADASQSPETITVAAPLKARTWIDARIHADLKPSSTVKVIDQPADEPELIISPMPTVSGSKS